MSGLLSVGKPQAARAVGRTEGPFKILLCAQMRRLCRELTPAALKVWLYHYARSNEGDTSHPRLDTIASGTNQNVKTVKHARKFLRVHGWLETTGWKPAHLGRGVPIEHPVFPKQASLRVQKAPLIDLSLRGQKAPGPKCPHRSRFKDLEVEEGSESAGSNHRFPLNPPKPTNALTPRTIEGKRQAAKEILLENGHDADVVEIALLRAAHLASELGKIPRLTAYFVRSGENSLGDEEELATCRRIAAQRKIDGIPMHASLQRDEWHDAAKIAFVHRSVEDADRLGRPAREIQAERLAHAAAAEPERASFAKRVRRALTGNAG